MFQVFLRRFQGYLKEVKNVCQENFKGDSRKFQKSFKEVSGMFQESFKGILKFQGYFKDD